MSPTHQHNIDRYWATDLAIPQDFQPKAKGVYCTVQELYSGVQFFLRDDWLVIAAPPQRAAQIAECVRDVPACEVFSVEFVKRLLFPDVGAIIGPAEVSYADALTFGASPTGDCGCLTSADADAQRVLAEALSSSELEQSGFSADATPAFGAFVEGSLCAMASYEIWEPNIAHITVATHPDHRRSGLGAAVVSALAEEAFQRGLVLQWRSLSANPNSLALSRALGFVPYCTTLYARPAGL